MYWILASERSDEYELSIDDLPAAFETFDVNFDYGNFISKNISTIDAHYVQHGEERKTDNLVAPTRVGLLINNKVKAVFGSLNIQNMQYFAARLIDKATKSVDENYCFANVVGKYACVDQSQSELVLFDDGEIEFIDKLVLDLSEFNDYGHIFRLAEFPSLLVISQELKTKIEEIGLTGFKVYNPEEFSL